MDAELLKTVGQITGIGGLALGVFLIIFRDLLRKSIFPTLKKDDAYRLLRLITVLTWSVAVVGIGAWVWIETRPAPLSNSQPARMGSASAGTGIANTGTQTFQGPLNIGLTPEQVRDLALAVSRQGSEAWSKVKALSDQPNVTNEAVVGFLRT